MAPVAGRERGWTQQGCGSQLGRILPTTLYIFWSPWKSLTQGGGCLSQPGPLTLQPCWLVWASGEWGGQGFGEQERGARHLTTVPVPRTPVPRSTQQGPRAQVGLAAKTTMVDGKILIPSQPCLLHLQRPKDPAKATLGGNGGLWGLHIWPVPEPKLRTRRGHAPSGWP